jgi:hypothetical protein
MQRWRPHPPAPARRACDQTSNPPGLLPFLQNAHHPLQADAPRFGQRHALLRQQERVKRRSKLAAQHRPPVRNLSLCGADLRATGASQQSQPSVHRQALLHHDEIVLRSRGVFARKRRRRIGRQAPGPRFRARNGNARVERPQLRAIPFEPFQRLLLRYLLCRRDSPAA